MTAIKQQLYEMCFEAAQERLATVEKTIHSHKTALASETKSSAGDKHETGRAMLQLEMEKAGQQLASIQQMKETLSKINWKKESSVASLGSLIETNLGAYYLSVSVGQLQLEDKHYFAISVSSPIGALLLGKKAGEQLSWNGREIKIHKIS